MSDRSPRGAVLGAGVTGLAAGLASGLPVYEASVQPGGICRSYGVRPEPGGGDAAPGSPETYRFEVGGGHWIFGGSARVTRLLERFSPLRHYARRSAVALGTPADPTPTRLVPYPLQYHLGHLPSPDRDAILAEMRSLVDAPACEAPPDLDAWLRSRFGPTLHRLFFGPFHERYTAGLARRVRIEDRDKTPIDWDEVERGAAPEAVSPDTGYNAHFVYPECGLDELARRMGAECDLRTGHRVTAIDLDRRRISFEAAEDAPFDRLVSTLPLDRTLALCGLDAGEPDPHTGVRVLNLGARRGPRCPDAHWVYVPESRSGFHRVGFYSNVDEGFLPVSRRGGDWVSLYVERATRADAPRDPGRDAARDEAAIAELRDWGWIGEVEAAHASHVEVAYTWRRPGSEWRERALSRLAQHGIRAAGRYATWRFQGIARSIESGLDAGGDVAREIGASPRRESHA